jgi:primosomal protein N' (replication factor Y)
MIFAHVAVSVPARVATLFTYSVPPRMSIQAGNLVMVPFGSRTLPGIVVEIDRVPPGLATRELLGPVEGAPIVEAGRVRVALWMARHYRAPLFDALGLFLPPAWQHAVRQRPQADQTPLWTFQWPQPPISAQTPVALGPEAEAAALGGAATGLRARVVGLLRPKGSAPAGEVAAQAGCSLLTVRRMVAEGILTAEYTPAASYPPGIGWAVAGQSVLLNEAQEAAFSAVATALESRTHRVFLLHGVTGSGKTQVYLRLIETLVGMGRRAIVLVSEIAQTSEALERYSDRFPGRVALLHSDLPDAERWQLWREVQEGRFDVVVGPRSALFAPVSGLGLVVVDEEHEPAYKQEDRSPRYHARQVAIELAREMGAAVVLGSATPDISSYYLAEKGYYQLLSLPERYAGPSGRGWSAGALPQVEVVDLREELKAGNSSILSRSLQAGIERTLDAHQQAILFLNRRGASTCVLCRDCGYVLKCRRCDVPLVYHRDTEELVCHQCNRRGPLPAKCPQCKRNRIGFFGAGTERVEEEVRRLFPSARVLRWDHDVAGGRGAHQRIHRQFQEHEADILVGTQMVAKALDFPLVTLVGVVLADVTLHLPDFRAAERTFQLLAQVAGRAGRGEAEGHVVIQTYSPDHYSVVAAGRHDYRAFYEQELAFRRRHSYPPFRDLTRLLYSGVGEVRSRFNALEMAKALQGKAEELGLVDLDILGPAPAFHSRLRGRFRWQIILVGEDSHGLLPEVELPLGWSVDVDPVSLL